jgi:hypothetical protein
MSNAVENIKGDFVRIASTYNTQIQGQLFLNNTNVNQVVENPSSLPSQTGNNGRYLRTDGTSASWDFIAFPPPSPLVVVQGPTISTPAPTTFDMIPRDVLSTEYTLSLRQGMAVRTSKIFVQSDGTTAKITESNIANLGTPAYIILPSLTYQAGMNNNYELKLEISTANSNPTPASPTDPVQVRFSRVVIS